MKDLTVIMYHYVRDLQFSRYPNIKGLDVNLFKEQIAYLKKNYNPVDISMVIGAFAGEVKLPPKAVLLTFDDAYIDHFQTAFPILYDNHMQGCFYAPVKAVTEHTVLDVNKIHFIIEQTKYDADKINDLVAEIRNLLLEYRREYSLSTFDYYFGKLAIAGRFDSKEVTFIKRLLQVELDEKLRNIITDRLFKKYVLRNEIPEEVFSRELYMNIDQMRCMVDCGMHIGSHGYDHYWLGSLPREKQEHEIKKSVEFIKQIGGDINSWTICYPYGDYNQDTIDLCRKNGCKLGFTTEVDLADTSSNVTDAIFKIPRLDTNDIPKDADAETNRWFDIPNKVIIHID